MEKLDPSIVVAASAGGGAWMVLDPPSVHTPDSVNPDPGIQIAVSERVGGARRHRGVFVNAANGFGVQP